MYIWQELDSSLFETQMMIDRTEDYPYYEAIDTFVENFIEKLNKSLADINRLSPLIGLYELVFENKTEYEDIAEPNFFYCYDFYISARTLYGSFESRGYRMQINTKNPTAMQIGIRTTPQNSLDTKKTWAGECLHRRSGNAVLFRTASISAGSVSLKNASLLEKSTTWVRVWGQVWVLATESTLCVYTNRGKYPWDIISFVTFRDVLRSDLMLPYANGWACDGSEIMAGDKRENYSYSSTRKLDAAPKIWLRDVYILNADKDIRWFLPNIYLTDENRVQHCAKSRTIYINPTTGLAEQPLMWMGFIGTFLTEKRYMMAVK